MGIMMIAGTERRRQGCSLQDGKQWGFTNNTGRPYITFPFKFSNVFTAISCICHNGSPSEANTVYNVSISGMNIGASGGGSGKYWCAFGVAQQQWGFTVFDPVDYKNVNFTLPLSVNGTFCAFSTGYDPKGSTFLWHSMSHFNNVNVGVTGFVFDSRYTFTGLGYLAVCWQKQWGYYTAAVGAIYTDVTTPVSFSRCFLAASIDILLAASTTWPGTTQTVWNINASTANKLRFIWAKAPIELDGAVWFGIFIQTVGILFITYSNISNSVSSFGTIHCSRTKNHKHVSYGNRSRIFRYYQC